tara:strand:+ start:941 stop:1489 length:549 start_codon:yes stop_codon:yes gene_type:complete
MNVINEIKTLLGMEVKLAQMKLKDGVTVLEADAFEVDNNVFIINGDERIAVPVGEYELEDGNILKVEVEGVIASLEAPVQEAPTEEAPIEEEVVASAEVSNAPKKIIESVSKEIFFAEIEKLRTEIAELKLAKEVVKAELNADVIVEPLTHSPENKSDLKLNKISPNRQMTTKDIVMAKLFN